MKSIHKYITFTVLSLFLVLISQQSSMSMEKEKIDTADKFVRYFATETNPIVVVQHPDNPTGRDLTVCTLERAIENCDSIVSGIKKLQKFLTKTDREWNDNPNISYFETGIGGFVNSVIYIIESQKSEIEKLKPQED